MVFPPISSVWLYSAIYLLYLPVSPCLAVKKIPLLMPDVAPTEKETYLCTAFRMPRHDHEYIVEFEPNATMHTAHHILIYGCTQPGYWERDSPRVVWNCGEMGDNKKSEYIQRQTCSSGSQVIYAWARDAPALTLPKGVGFKVGGTTGVNYLVLQVHYANVDKFLNGETDNSGIILTTLPSTTDKVDKRAGVYLLGSGGTIPAKHKENMETSCTIDEPVTIHPFAFRTHTHALGKVVSGYIVKDGVWHLVGKHDPLKPQMFYPVENKDLTATEGDTLAARCTMYNFRDHQTSVGATANDEMCNFYMMYYVDGDRILREKFCFTNGPPWYRWMWDPKVGEVPNWVEKSASELDE